MCIYLVAVCVYVCVNVQVVVCGGEMCIYLVAVCVYVCV